MRAKDAERAAVQALAGIALGVPVRNERIFANQARGLADGAQAMALPADVSRYAEIGVVSTGALYFMMEKDPLDGTNALA